MEGSIVEVEEIELAKHIIIMQLQKWKGLNPDDTRKIRRRLEESLRQEASSALFVVGPRGTGKGRIIQYVLSQVATELNLREKKCGGDGVSVVIVRVSGMWNLSDAQILRSILDQLRGKTALEKYSGVVLEDLEIELKQSRTANSAVFIVIDNIHEFLKREKQTLIYTLLDLMHNEAIHFTLIGLTHLTYLNQMMEKRVLSRLNTQFVVLSSLDSDSICRQLSRSLKLHSSFLDGDALKTSVKRKLEVDDSYRNGNSLRIDSSASSSPAASTIESHFGTKNKFVLKFNEAVEYLFGRYTMAVQSPAHEDQNADADLSDTEQDLRQLQQLSRQPSVLWRGAMYSLIDAAVSWGRTKQYFYKAAMLAIFRLNEKESFFTVDVFRETLAAQETPSLRDTLRTLPLQDVLVFAALARLQSSNHSKAIRADTVHTAGAAAGGGVEQRHSTALYGAHSAHSGTVEDVHAEVEKLSSAGSRVLTTAPLARHAKKGNAMAVVYRRDVEQSLQRLCELGLAWIPPASTSSAGGGGGPESGMPTAPRITSVSPQSCVYLVPPVHEVQVAFSAREMQIVEICEGAPSTDSSVISGEAVGFNSIGTRQPIDAGQQQQQHMGGASKNRADRASCLSAQSQRPIVISERVRRAVLRPLEPMTHHGTMAMGNL